MTWRACRAALLPKLCVVVSTQPPSQRAPGMLRAQDHRDGGWQCGLLQVIHVDAEISITLKTPFPPAEWDERSESARG